MVALWGCLGVLLGVGLWNTAAVGQVPALPRAVALREEAEILKDLAPRGTVAVGPEGRVVKASIQSAVKAQDPASLGQAQNPILYIPLDNRPPNWLPCVWNLASCPPALLYAGRSGVDPQALREWLEQTPGQQLVVSLDALSYGGLVQGRLAGIKVEETLRRMEAVREWQDRTGGKVLAFGVIPRFPDAKARERNLEVLQEIEDWAGDSFYLEATWDDAVQGSPAVQEAKNIPYFSRPGADEAGQLLLLRALRPGLRVKVVYDQPAAASQATRYEGLALRDTVERMLGSAGAEAVEVQPQLVLLVYTGQAPRQAVLTLMREARAAPVAVADISRPNRGDPTLVNYLLKLGRYSGLAAYSSWGTPGNNIGSALAQGGLFLGDRQRREEALAEAYVQYLWGEVGRPWVRERFPEPLSEEAARYVLDRLRSEPLTDLGGPKLELLALKFPWQRSFEASLEYRLVQPELPEVER
jgi:hypothetical protein